MAVIALRWFKAALVLQILLVAYWLTTEVGNLFPWNDLASRAPDYNLHASIALNALPLIALTGLFALGLRPLAMVSVAGYVLYFIGQVWYWWKPAVLGSENGPPAYNAAAYGRTLKIIPPFSADLPPDANHLTLQVLTLATVVVAAMAVSRMRYL